MTLDDAHAIYQHSEAIKKIYKEDLENLTPKIEKDELIKKINITFFTRGDGSPSLAVFKDWVRTLDYNVSDEIINKINDGIETFGFYTFYRNKGLSLYNPDDKTTIIKTFSDLYRESDSEIKNPNAELIAMDSIIKRIELLERADPSIEDPPALPLYRADQANEKLNQYFVDFEKATSTDDLKKKIIIDQDGYYRRNRTERNHKYQFASSLFQYLKPAIQEQIKAGAKGGKGQKAIRSEVAEMITNCILDHDGNRLNASTINTHILPK